MLLEQWRAVHAEGATAARAANILHAPRANLYCWKPASASADCPASNLTPAIIANSRNVDEKRKESGRPPSPRLTPRNSKGAPAAAPR